MLERYSPSGQEKSIAEYLQSYMASHGFHSWIDEVGNVIGEIGHGEDEVLLLGHIDTVPGYIPVKIQGDEIFGRGAVDAKGALAAFVTAASKVGASAIKRIIVIGAVDEENNSKGAHYTVNKFHPRYVIVGEPSGWNAITLGYKGVLKIKCSITKPKQHNAHKASTASEDLVDFWNRIGSYCHSFNEGKRIFEKLDPSLQEFHSHSDAFSDAAECYITFRTPPGLSAPELKKVLKDLQGDIDIAYVMEVQGLRSEKNNPLVKCFLQAIRELGSAPRFKLKTGTSDMNIVAPLWKAPIVAYGPGDSSFDHTPEERLNLHEFMWSIKLLRKVLETI